MAINRLKALVLLTECNGDDIWSVEHCQLRGVPESWVSELADCFESGFSSDTQTIYVGNTATNQYMGVRDVDLAKRIGIALGVDVDRLCDLYPSRADLVRAIKEAIEEE